MRCKLTDLWRSHELRTDLEEEELATSHYRNQELMEKF
jgi:hypothetical protein